MYGTKSCAILGHSPMRFAWGFDEEAAECHDMTTEAPQQSERINDPYMAKGASQ